VPDWTGLAEALGWDLAMLAAAGVEELDLDSSRE